MKLFLYKTVDATNVINKTLTDELIIDFNFRGDIDLVNPDLILVGEFTDYNYAVIPELNRSYFIDSIDRINLRMVKLHLQCDVIETYKNNILNLSGDITRVVKNGDIGYVTGDSNLFSVDHVESTAELIFEQSITLTTLEKKDNA